MTKRNKLFYFDSDVGCGIRSAADLETAKENILREVGERGGLKDVHEATEREVQWVSSMGGDIPET